MDCTDVEPLRDGAAGGAGGGGEGDAAPRILLVEDHADTRGVMERLLRWDGYAVTAAAGFGAALKVATAASEPFDLLIADIVLPDGCGWTLFERLRAEHPSLVGIVLSGHGMPEHVARSHAAGFCVHVTKPVEFTLLKAEIRRCLSGRDAMTN